MLAGSLGFVNADVTLHVWGPTTIESAVTYAQTLGHQPKEITDAHAICMSCTNCQLSMSDIVAPHFFGRMLDEQCHPKGTR